MVAKLNILEIFYHDLKYKIQKIDGLPEKKVTPPKEVYERIKRVNQIIGKARSINSNLTFFKNKFINKNCFSYVCYFIILFYFYF